MVFATNKEKNELTEVMLQAQKSWQLLLTPMVLGLVLGAAFIV